MNATETNEVYLLRRVGELQEQINYLIAWTGAEPTAPQVDEKPTYKGHEFVKALTNLYNAAIAVNKEWEILGDQDIYLDDPAGAYPFNDDDFQDLVKGVGKWVESVTEELKTNYPIAK